MKVRKGKEPTFQSDCSSELDTGSRCILAAGRANDDGNQHYLSAGPPPPLPRCVLPGGGVYSYTGMFTKAQNRRG